MKWIKVDDKLPDELIRVLCFDSYNKISHTAVFMRGLDGYRFFVTPYIGIDADYWLSLPAPT